MSEEPGRFKKKNRIRIIDKIRHPLIWTTIKTERADVVHFLKR